MNKQEQIVEAFRLGHISKDEASGLLSQINTRADISNSAASGLVRGLPKTIDALGAGVAWAAQPITGVEGTYAQFRNQGGLNELANKLFGPEYQPLTPSGEYAKAATEGVSTMVAAPIGGAATVGGNVLRNLVVGAGGGAGGKLGSDIGGPIGGVIGSVLGGGMALPAARFTRGLYEGATNAVPKPVRGSPAQVEEAKKAAYDALDASATMLDQGAVAKFADDIEAQLKRQGYVASAPEYAPIAQKLTELRTKPQADMTPAGMDAFMKGLSDTAGSPSPAARLAGQFKRGTGKFLDDVGVPEVRAARNLNKDFENNNMIAEVFKNAEFHRRTTGYENALLDGMISLARDPERMATLAPAAREAVEKAAKVGFTDDTLRRLSAFSVMNGQLGMATGGLSGVTALTTGSGLPALLPVVGTAADLARASVIKGRAANARSMIERGVPTYPASERAGQALGGVIGKAIKRK